MTVLIIDDEPGLRQTVSLILNEEGYQTHTAADGEDGLARALELKPDIILCDVRMPRLGGLEFLEKYRASGGAGMVIMMTAYGGTELAIQAMKAGAYDYLPKPFSPDQLILVLKKAQEREALRQEVSRLREEVGIQKRLPPDHRALARHDEGARGRREGRAAPVAGAHHGRERHRQGARRAPDPRRERPRRRAVRAGQLRRDPGEPARVRAVRLRARRVQRRRPRQARACSRSRPAARSSSTRSATCPPRCRSSCCACCRRARSAGSATRAPARWTSASSPPRTRTSTRRCAPARSARTSTTASPSCPSISCRCASAATTSRCSCATSWTSTTEAPPRHQGRRSRRNAAAPRVLLARQRARAREHHRARHGPRRRAHAHVDDLPDQVRTPLPGDDGADLGDDELSVKKHGAALERRLIRKALERTGGNKTRAADLLELSSRALLYKIREYGLD
jgi:CheY-like chemotaxis protein